jgi:hypothetical protein
MLRTTERPNGHDGNEEVHPFLKKAKPHPFKTVLIIFFSAANGLVVVSQKA